MRRGSAHSERGLDGARLNVAFSVSHGQVQLGELLLGTQDGKQGLMRALRFVDGGFDRVETPCEIERLPFHPQGHQRNGDQRRELHEPQDEQACREWEACAVLVHDSSGAST